MDKIRINKDRRRPQNQEKLKEIARKKALSEELASQGWVTTGDLPYIVTDHFLNKFPTLTITHYAVRHTMDRFLKGLNEGIRKIKVREGARNQMHVHPELAKQIEEEVKKRYKVEYEGSCFDSDSS